MLGKKCRIEFICTILKFLYRNGPDDIKIPILGATFKVRERIGKSYLWGCCRIIEKLPDMDRDGKNAAAKFFAEWKKRITIPFLDEWMSKEPDPILKSMIASVIGEIGGRYAVKALVRAMGAEDQYVWLGVTDALEKQGRRALKEVIKCANSDNPQIRRSVAKVLCNIGGDDPHVRSVLAQLRRDPDESVQNIFNIYCGNVYIEGGHQIEIRGNNEKRK